MVNDVYPEAHRLSSLVRDLDSLARDMEEILDNAKAPKTTLLNQAVDLFRQAHQRYPRAPDEWIMWKLWRK